MSGPIPGLRGHVLTASLVLLVAVGTFVAFLRIGGGLPSIGKEPYTVEAVLPTSASLVRGSRVSMAGAPVGRVTEIGRRGLSTLVTLELDDERVTPLPTDSRFVLRQRTPVGENYIAITPGRAKDSLPGGGRLPISQADDYVEVDEILSVLRGRTRDRARTLLQSTGEALDGRGDELNEVLGGASSAIQAGSKAFTILDASRDDVGRVVARLGSIMDAVGERSASVAAVAREGLRSVEAIAAQDETLRTTLDVLPSTLGQVERTSRRVGTVSRSTAPVLAEAALAIRDIRPAVSSLRPAAQEGRQLLDRVSTTAPKLDRTLARVRSLSGPLGKALPELEQTLCEINPVVRYVKPYADDVAQLVAGLGSASNGYDAIGHLIRITPIVNENSLVGLPDEVSAAAHTLLRAGFLSKSMGLTRNPYPAPGRNGKDGAGTGKDVITAKQVKDSGYVFPRVMADC